MVGRYRNDGSRIGSRVGWLLLAFALALAAASPAHAQDCSDYGGVLDGAMGTIPPSQLQIDQNCTIRNYPASNPLPTNFSFFTQPGQTDVRYLVVFDNVVHTGNMSCNATHEHKIWFTNGSSSKIKSNCQNLLIPVEKIDKQNPAGQTTAAIGVPFTYSLTIPVLFDPATDTVINTAGSVNDLHSVTLTDDLNATGVDLTYVSHIAYWESSGLPVAHTFSNVGGLLTFDAFPVIPAGEQITIELTVVLDDTPTNAPGTQFVNTAKWDFGRLIDDVFFEPLPGEWGISEPLTIAAPDLVVTKSGPTTLGLTLNLGQWGTFTIDVHNTGLTDAWDVTLLDQLPDGATGGMCDLTPEILSAQVFEADGTTPVSPVLVQGTDFSFAYAGPPTCELTLTMLTPQARIGPDQRLIVTYRTQLDPDTQDGVTLTNVVGATEWFNGDATNPDRVVFTRTLTDGTPGTPDHEDAHTVTSELFGFFFEKTAQNLTTGVNPAAAAAPGDVLRYTLRLQATDVALSDLTFYDDFADLNAGTVFVPGSLALVTVPAGADTSNTNPNGGANGEGILDIRGLDVPANSEIIVEFDLTLDATLPDGTAVTNQADLLAASKIADSDDPNVNGQSDPDVDGDEDPTVVIVSSAPVGPLVKANTQSTATVGETFSYQITVPETPFAFDIFDVRIRDNLAASAADLSFQGVTKISGSEPWTPVNTGTATDLVIEDTSIGIDIPAGEQIVVEITVLLEDTPTNVAGLTFTNSASYLYNRIDGDVGSQLPGDPDTTEPMTVVEPELTLTKSGPATMTVGTPETFTLDVQNTGGGAAWNPTVTDLLPDTPSGGTCGTAPATVTAQVFASDGTTPVSGVLVQGTDYTLGWSGAPSCLLSLAFLTDATTIGPGERLIVTYQAELDAGSQHGATLTNVAGAVEWSSQNAASPDGRTYNEVVTDGTVGTLDHEDAHTVTVAVPDYLFEKTVVNVTTGADPALTAVAGDVLRYTLRLGNASDVPLAGLAFVDDLGSLNPTPVFEPGTLTLVTVPAGADTSATDPTGGSNGTGLVDVRNLALPAMGQLVIEFEVTLAAALGGGEVITNQTRLLVDDAPFALSDDPNVNGPADPYVDGDEDPTVVTVPLPPAGPLLKTNGQSTASIGESFSYQITVPQTPFAFDIYDVQITDDLSASAADLRFLGVTKITGSEPWTPVNTGTATDLVIEDTSIGIDIPAGEQVVVEITVVLEDTPTNVSGLAFTNTASYVYQTVDGDPASQAPGDPDTTPEMTVVEPDLTLTKSGPATMTIGVPATFTLDVQNAGDGPAWNATLTDLLPDGATGGTCDTAPANVTAQVFESNGTTPVSGVLVQGTDYSLTWSGAPGCLLTITVLTDEGTVGPGERLILSYDAELDADTQDGVALTNVAGAVEWWSFDDTSPDRRVYTEVVTDGTVGTLDHEDAHTVDADLPGLLFEKTVVNVTTGADPATTATPGDVLRYTLRVENVAGVPLPDFDVVDDLGSLNAAPVFEPGTLVVVSIPAGADASATDPNGGSNGTGLLDVRGLALPALNDSLTIEFEITLAAVIANGTLVTNQSRVEIDGTTFLDSDDPNVNGPADPDVAGDEDPTQVAIQSAPAFRVEKVSAYVTGSPSVLLAGETLRYTITVANVGSDDAVDVSLRDAVPANTTYVPGSTTLNGASVPDGAGGIAPLASGILVNAPSDPTPGFLPADPTADPSNVATVVFDVVVDPNVVDGTILSNQGFVTTVPGGVVDQPSDDPRTSLPDDPTRDVVGNFPLLFAAKDATLVGTVGSPGIVDPGDTLLYTITVFNSGSTPATDAVLQDAVPANTSYVPGTTTLNGIAVPDAPGGVSPLVAGLPISSSDLTPPLPGAGAGVLSGGESAVVEFQLQVDIGVAGGTVISNQATVSTNEAPDLPTDGDGDPSTGPEPTLVVVGAGQQLSIDKQVAVVGGGPVLAGSTLEYLVRVVNVAAVPALSVVITDDLVPDLTYVPGSATLDGAAAGVVVAGSLITADYSAVYGPLQPGEVAVLRFQAVVDPIAPIGTTIPNTGTVTWNTTQTESDTVTVDVGGTPGVGVLNGRVWHDVDFDDAFDAPPETPLAGWSVALHRNGALLQQTTTDASGVWSMSGLTPNDLNGDQYALFFSAPGAGSSTASLGFASSPFTNGPQQITDIVFSSGSNLQDLDLPIDPNGVVYDAILRAPVAGAALVLQNAVSGAQLPSSCFDDPAQQGQVTGPNGWYKFDLNFSDALACPDNGTYLVAVAVPGSGFVAGGSQIIPPSSDATTPPLSVPTCPGGVDDAVLATAQYCEAQPQATAPAPTAAPGTPATAYFLHLLFDDAQVPGSSQIFNNHIPVDPVLDGALAITKTTPNVNVSRGQLVPYRITVRNDLGAPIPDLGIVDRFPPGFRYVEGSARIDGVPVEPVMNGQELRWDNVGIDAASSRTVVLLLAAGAGVSDGKYTNRAQAFSTASGVPLSGEATATVRIVPDPVFSCTDVMGKVFDDVNRNGIQDPGEKGLSGVRLVTTRGLSATTDAYGRYHITCAATPTEGRGSNFVLKLDDRTLPTGYRMSTRKSQVQRATRGKALRFNYAASIHRVVSLDMADPVFEPGTTTMRAQWRPRLSLLLDELRKEPSVLRLSYVADVEDAGLVEERLDAVKALIADAWKSEDGGYPLSIEPEVYWRRGAPVDAPAKRAPEVR